MKWLTLKHAALASWSNVGDGTVASAKEASSTTAQAGVEKEWVVRFPTCRCNENLHGRCLQFAVTRIEKCRTGKFTVNRLFEKRFTEEYLQDVGLTLDFHLGALMRRYHRDASDRSNTRM